MYTSKEQPQVDEILMPRQRRSFNRISGVRDPSLIVIATEGERTEHDYFRHLAEKLHESGIRLVVVEREPDAMGNSSPRHVLEQLNHYKTEYGIKQNDEFCMVIDRDRWPEAILSSVAQQCDQKGYVLAVSNPCFEFWLLLHHCDVHEDFDEKQRAKIELNANGYMKDLVREKVGVYNPSNISMDDFFPYTQQAVERARTLDINPIERWPGSLGSRVYRVIEKLPI